MSLSVVSDPSLSLCAGSWQTNGGEERQSGELKTIPAWQKISKAEKIEIREELRVFLQSLTLHHLRPLVLRLLLYHAVQHRPRREPGPIVNWKWIANERRISWLIYWYQNILCYLFFKNILSIYTKKHQRELPSFAWQGYCSLNFLEGRKCRFQSNHKLTLSKVTVSVHLQESIFAQWSQHLFDRFFFFFSLHQQILVY